MDNSEISKALGVQIIESSEMNDRIAVWRDVYSNKSSWVTERVEGLELASSVSTEFSRLVLTEFKAELNNSTVDKQFKRFLNGLSKHTEMACALGGVIFKPYVCEGRILTDVSSQDEFLPIAYTDDVLTSVICPDYLFLGDVKFTRLEYHNYNQSARTHTIENHCFKSESRYSLGEKCNLSSVSAWSNLAEKTVFYDVDMPLFSYFKMPFANNVDSYSPLGVSVYCKAINLFKQADIHWERNLWEYESSERAINAAEDLFRHKDNKPILPSGRERMFMTYDIQADGTKPFIETFSPQIRDEAMESGLNRIFQRIEFNCGLGYGTLSNLSTIEKTAEEIKTSKQRSYANINAIQRELQNALESLAYAYGYYSKTNVELTCTFGDSVLEDTEKEFQRRLQMVTSGLLSKEKFNAWYFGCSEDEAKEYISKDNGLFGDV